MLPLVKFFYYGFAWRIFGWWKLGKRNFRQLWNIRINAEARNNGISYSKLMHGLKLANIEVNRKMLSELAIFDAEGFKALCDTAKAALEK